MYLLTLASDCLDESITNTKYVSLNERGGPKSLDAREVNEHLNSNPIDATQINGTYKPTS